MLVRQANPFDGALAVIAMGKAVALAGGRGAEAQETPGMGVAG